MEKEKGGENEGPIEEEEEEETYKGKLNSLMLSIEEGTDSFCVWVKLLLFYLGFETHKDNTFQNATLKYALP